MAKESTASFARFGNVAIVMVAVVLAAANINFLANQHALAHLMGARGFYPLVGYAVDLFAYVNALADFAGAWRLDTLIGYAVDFFPDGDALANLVGTRRFDPLVGRDADIDPFGNAMAMHGNSAEASAARIANWDAHCAGDGFFHDGGTGHTGDVDARLIDPLALVSADLRLAGNGDASDGHAGFVGPLVLVAPDFSLAGNWDVGHVDTGFVHPLMLIAPNFLLGTRFGWTWRGGTRSRWARCRTGCWAWCRAGDVAVVLFLEQTEPEGLGGGG